MNKRVIDLKERKYPLVALRSTYKLRMNPVYEAEDLEGKESRSNEKIVTKEVCTLKRAECSYTYRINGIRGIINSIRIMFIVWCKVEERRTILKSFIPLN